MRFTAFESDLGTFLLFARADHLSRLDLVSVSRDKARDTVKKEFPDAIEAPEAFDTAEGLLLCYSRGDRVNFTLPVDLTGLNPFAKRVLTEIRSIPYGRTASYGMIARRLGTSAARAVGQALKINPIPIVIPCHRVVRGDGSLGGFEMGLDMKVRLLSLEGVPVHELQKSMTPPGQNTAYEKG
jgi:methylated-DNA-[protein]-cysteine S-methyltransferase